MVLLRARSSRRAVTLFPGGMPLSQSPGQGAHMEPLTPCRCQAAGESELCEVVCVSGCAGPNCVSLHARITHKQLKNVVPHKQARDVTWINEQ